MKSGASKSIAAINCTNFVKFIKLRRFFAVRYIAFNWHTGKLPKLESIWSVRNYWLVDISNAIRYLNFTQIFWLLRVELTMNCIFLGDHNFVDCMITTQTPHKIGEIHFGFLSELPTLEVCFTSGYSWYICASIRHKIKSFALFKRIYWKTKLSRLLYENKFSSSSHFVFLRMSHM